MCVCVYVLWRKKLLIQILKDYRESCFTLRSQADVTFTKNTESSDNNNILLTYFNVVTWNFLMCPKSTPYYWAFLGFYQVYKWIINLFIFILKKLLQRHKVSTNPTNKKLKHDQNAKFFLKFSTMVSKSEKLIPKMTVKTSISLQNTALERYFVIRKPITQCSGDGSWFLCGGSSAGDLWKNVHFLRTLACLSWLFCFGSNTVFFFTYAVSIPQDVTYFGMDLQVSCR